MKKFILVFLVFALSVSMSGCALLLSKAEEKAYEQTMDTYEQIMGDIYEQTFENNEAQETVASTEDAKKFYDKIREGKTILDLIATDVCAAWKDASSNYKATTKEINDAIEKAKDANSENIKALNEIDSEILVLFDKAKKQTQDYLLQIDIKQVMTRYSEYKKLILEANEALNSNGYLSISTTEGLLERALVDLFVNL